MNRVSRLKPCFFSVLYVVTLISDLNTPPAGFELSNSFIKMRFTEGRTRQCEGINVERSASGGASPRILSFVNRNLDLTLDHLKIVYSDLHPSSRLNIQISPMKLAFP